MKTFEERYTAWIDDRLEGNALGAFEQELARRAAAAEAQADKADAGRLRSLLRENLTAPALTNAEFFSLQVRERIDAERGASRRPRFAPEASPWLRWFTGPVTRFVGLGAAALFVAGALYYGMMPPHTAAPETMVARSVPLVSHEAGPEAQPAAIAAATPAVGRGQRSGDELMARNDIASPDDIDDESPGFAARVPDPATTTATATPLHYKDANVNVLWINGLDYMPAVPGGDAGAPQPPVPSAAPSASTNPHHG